MYIRETHTYDVVPGEPHLGKQIETTVVVERDEYIDGIIDCILNIEDGFTLSEDGIEIDYNLSDNIDEATLINIYDTMNRELLDDDDGGSDKEYQLVYKMVDDIVPEDFEDEYTIVAMRG